METPLKDHWNKKNTDIPITQLGWYETKSMPSIQLIENCGVSKTSLIADIGSGTSTLISNLLELGYQNIYAVDISEVALEKSKTLRGKEQTAQMHWLVEDITNPSAMLQQQEIAVWHDRAVFHFLTKEKDRLTCHSLVQKTVMSGGFVIWRLLP